MRQTFDIRIKADNSSLKILPVVGFFVCPVYRYTKILPLRMIRVPEVVDIKVPQNQLLLRFCGTFAHIITFQWSR